jgi:hypothetical protein
MEGEEQRPIIWNMPSHIFNGDNMDEGVIYHAPPGLGWSLPVDGHRCYQVVA